MPQHRQHTAAAARQQAYRTRQTQARLAEQQATGLPPAAPIPTLPSRARWQALIAQARLCVETAYDEMPLSSDDRSEAWQAGERAATLQDRLDQLEGVINDLDALSSA
jgi:hypothetical protein